MLSVLDSKVVGAATAGIDTPLLCAGINSSGGALTVKRTLVRLASLGINVVNVVGPQLVSNTLKNNESVGIFLRSVTGGLVQSNLATRNNIGIRVADASVGVTLDANDARGNAGTDCIDTSTGPNTWTATNQGDETSGAAVC